MSTFSSHVIIKEHLWMFIGLCWWICIMFLWWFLSITSSGVNFWCKDVFFTFDNHQRNTMHICRNNSTQKRFLIMASEHFQCSEDTGQFMLKFSQETRKRVQTILYVSYPIRMWAIMTFHNYSYCVVQYIAAGLK